MKKKFIYQLYLKKSKGKNQLLNNVEMYKIIPLTHFYSSRKKAINQQTKIKNEYKTETIIIKHTVE